MCQINSIGELVKVISATSFNWGKNIWYRGQANSSWSLLPSLLRLGVNASDIWEKEDIAIKTFKQSSKILLSNNPETEIELLFWMQHHGVPTRLLDWSESPLVALYFALNSSAHENNDATIWLLNPILLNKNASISSYENFIPAFDDEEILSSYYPDKIRANTRITSKPVALIATRNNSRIQAQQGTFTMHHLDLSPIDELGDKEHIKKIIIPQKSKASLNKELQLLGFSHFQLFPELDSIGKIIKESI